MNWYTLGSGTLVNLSQFVFYDVEEDIALMYTPHGRRYGRVLNTRCMPTKTPP